MNFRDFGYSSRTSSTYFKLKCPKCGVQKTVGVRRSDDPLRCIGCQVSLVPDAETQSIAPDMECRRCGISFWPVDTDRCAMCNEPLWLVH